MHDAAAHPQTYLAAYAREFGTVEIDSTFYGTPSPQRVRRWAAGHGAGMYAALGLSHARPERVEQTSLFPYQ